MYGMGAFRLARDSDLTLAEAEEFIAKYFARMPGVKDYIDRTKVFVWETGYTETLYGRRRIYPAIKANAIAEAQPPRSAPPSICQFRVRLPIF